MLKPIRYYPTQILLGFLMATLQTTLLIKLGGLNILVILVLNLILLGHFLGGGVVALCFGLALDVLAGTPTGLSSVLFLAFYYVAWIIRRNIHLDHPFHQFIAVLVADAVYQLILARYAGDSWPPLQTWASVLATGAVAPFVFSFTAWLDTLQTRLTKPRTVE